MVNVPRALFKTRTGRQARYHIAIEQMPEWTYSGRTTGASQGISRRCLGSLKKEAARPTDIRWFTKLAKAGGTLKSAPLCRADGLLAPTQRRRAALQKTSQDRYRELCHVVTAPPRAILSGTRNHWFCNQGERMKSVNELLELFTRQAALEKAMRQPGGARVIEEQELLAVRRELAKLPEAMGISLPDRRHRSLSSRARRAFTPPGSRAIGTKSSIEGTNSWAAHKHPGPAKSLMQYGLRNKIECEGDPRPCDYSIVLPAAIHRWSVPSGTNPRAGSNWRAPAGLRRKSSPARCASCWVMI